MNSRFYLFPIFAVLAFPASSFCATPGASPDPLLGIMRKELNRAHAALASANPAPYFVSYSVVDHTAFGITGSQGALYNSTQARQRSADVAVRLGSPTFDNTHGQARYSGLSTATIPVENDPDAIARVLWHLTDREYQKASQAYLKVKTDSEVRAKEEDASADFSAQAAVTRIDAAEADVSLDKKAGEDLVRAVSGEFRKYPNLTQSVVLLQADQLRHYFVSTEGSEVLRPEKIVRLMIQAETQADDGMELLRVESFQASNTKKLPALPVILAKVATMAADLEKLRAAPVAEPFSGPAMLSGRAAAVLFHEVLGHRLEGQRQRGDEEGQTFTKKIEQRILPEFLSVVDDPTLAQLSGMELSGWYEADEEGQPAQRVELIHDGVLKSFLMSRMPVKGFDKSNGHGRAQPGYMPAGRQGNLIVESSRQIAEQQLRQQFVQEIKKQGKSYGLYFEDIEGGFTLTTRQLPQAFQVLPVMVWRVYADERPDELVRGVNIVGTPLAAMSHIIATGDREHVFNGICGAESGNIPVSAAAPAMLFSEIEVQRKDQGHDRPPLLPPPSLTAEIQKAQ